MKKFSNVVYIVDDDLAMLKSLSWLLDSIQLKSKSYENALDFLKEYQSDWQGCILIDVRMPVMSGLQLQEKLIAMKNSMPIIMLSAHADIDMAIQALKAGAKDFITKPFSDQTLLEKIQRVLALNPAQEHRLEVEKCYQTLTKREQTIMKKMVEGKTSKIIAGELNISSKTVELHRANIMQKMQTKQFASLVRMYCLLEAEEKI